MKLKNLNFNALLIATLSCILIIVLVYLGSRNLQNFDAALVTYLFGTIFAFFGIVYRTSVWLQRPPTWMYFKRGIYFLFTGKVFKHLVFVAKEFIGNIVLQKFIYPRGKYRWLAHFMIAIGCISAFMITIPLTFGWIHFTLAPGTINLYQAHFFGFEVFSFRLGSVIAFLTFHALNWSSWLVILGSLYYLRRRLTNPGLIATQTFDGDLLPLILLIAISATGLGLTYSYQFMKGFAFDFLAVLHAVTVILFLIWIPFGKFFHIIQRPAQIGAHIYKIEGKEQQGMAICPHTRNEFTTQLHVNDLKIVTRKLGFDFSKPDGTSHLDLSPEGKRSIIAQAHLKARQEGGNLFG
ncbi:MFS transporter [Flavobacterium oreochromis]|uniref:MFS transporter n=2 Tax=Flavobacterium TaxID=237 RepID=A0A246G899_9FLAO|nr:MFS transporter [Flavobacterium oreochromis]OWP75045.1 MFS transporter [Flavobacterium oreochromis]OWP75286.1 MFS transporter [Flavobacterium oreochromis]POR21351.1 MFS transporter [Flavobacterium columnare]QYS86253.1 MFS transporter [Flavobacterium oreochromis]